MAYKQADKGVAPYGKCQPSNLESQAEPVADRTNVRGFLQSFRIIKIKYYYFSSISNEKSNLADDSVVANTSSIS